MIGKGFLSYWVPKAFGEREKKTSMFTLKDKLYQETAGVSAPKFLVIGLDYS